MGSRTAAAVRIHLAKDGVELLRAQPQAPALQVLRDLFLVKHPVARDVDGIERLATAAPDFIDVLTEDLPQAILCANSAVRP